MYKRPYITEEIKKLYPDRADMLLNDPVHLWRAQTGIELIHKEPTLDEQKRIWQNWNEMTSELKAQSNAKSNELFGKDNSIHNDEIMKDWALITFPEVEWEAIKARLSENKIVFTVRVSNEYGKYHEGDILMTEWGEKIKILSVKNISGGIEELEREYLYFNELTPEMITELSLFNDMEIVSFSGII
jgi:hypothetical protein